MLAGRTQLTFTARGLLIYLLSLPPNWEVKVKKIIDESPAGRDAVYTMINELICAGYIQRIHNRESGQFTSIAYDVFECPQLKDNKLDTQERDPKGNSALNPHPGKPEVEEEPFPAFPDPVEPLPEKPYTYKVINKQNKQITKETAALEQRTDQQEKQIAAAVSLLSEDDVLISEELTENQKRYLRQHIHHLPKLQNSPSSDILFKQISVTLLSPGCFSNAGKDFLKKLNTILKLIKTGKWTTPSTFQIEKNEATKTIRDNQQAILQEYLMNKKHWDKLKEFAMKRGDKEHAKQFSRFIEQAQEKISQLKRQQCHVLHADSLQQ